MKLLAFDTSNQGLAVAVLEDQQVIASMQLNRKMNHSLTLMPAIEQLMKASGLIPKDLDRIVVAQGPGSYTGIRIAVTTAKTLADTLKIELVGVSSLASIAANFRTDSLIVPLFDARRKNVYAGGYRWEDQQLKAVFSDQHVSLDELLDNLKEPAIFVGEAEKFQTLIYERLPDANIITEDQFNLPNAVSLGRLGLEQNTVEDIHSFVPDYLKRVEAEENWLKTHPSEDTDYVEKI
ncbi:tRNA (adenosine(37)-N6)-threonylcarbamoyltransferase complex dimerization subunit type 1 TsaB [Enterococcus florum]|uniref:tRNA (Adenosine(37)-N6)-threonylcarbamoyltransferase complex dimerization subunit type 1 TsaB n=1 Tax=Enterococcus florum TaxID=2480627 RepID=A0A4V0WP16_9ENTE|nr:tRNA (adenosine(37)-N6)-threonylcarbamoyltransferase complex dimerization subunit type 1 TsaB [Enterococcus florum]GCF92289.1 tRNA (adenosine(37)-N6)-threonylcarbamoyltransferase complex dimerization subunit type 1 TsaB [Enterococcus florum]